MAKTEHFPAVAEARPHGNRAHVRRKLSPMAYVELGLDNGGILLNLSEGGFAVQSALALTSREFSELRFQIPAYQGWLTAKGRLAWVSDSRKEAGIQFTELPAESRREIEKWVLAESAAERFKERVPPRAQPITSSTGKETGRQVPNAERASRTSYEPKVASNAQANTASPDLAPERRVPAARPVGSPGAPPIAPTIRTERTETRRQVIDTPRRDRTVGYETSAARNAPVNATTPEREPTQIVERPRVGAAVAEPPPFQDFHFNDYSMFAPEPEGEAVWSQGAARREGNWRRVALGILVAGLFFALGATVGRESVDRWIAHVGGWTQNQLATAPPPKVTPPSTPEEPRTAAENKGEADRQSKDSASSEAEAKTGSDGNLSSKAEVDSGSGKSSNPADKKGNVEKPPASGTSPMGRAGENGGTVRSGEQKPTDRSGDNEPRAPRRIESAWVRGGRGIEAEAGAEHSILVNAPEPGSRPFYVNLPGEAVSASASIAMSARRILEIPPRSATTASGSERVVIGKLISHSEPFYPAEARKRGIEGSVQLRARVGRTGQVLSATPVSGPWLLFPAAVAAVREWRYEPTFVNGDPAETIADVTIVFRLR